MKFGLRPELIDLFGEDGARILGCIYAAVARSHAGLWTDLPDDVVRTTVPVSRDRLRAYRRLFVSLGLLAYEKRGSGQSGVHRAHYHVSEAHARALSDLCDRHRGGELPRRMYGVNPRRPTQNAGREKQTDQRTWRWTDRTQG